MATTPTALVVIDIQVGMIKPNDKHQEQVLQNIRTLIDKARSSNIPVIYIQHDGPAGDDLEEGTEGWHIHPAIAPHEGDTIVHKRASDSFHKTTLQAELQQRSIRHLVVAGGQTEYCVDTTVRRATTFGYDVTLVKDGHVTFGDEKFSEEWIVAFYNRTLNYFSTDDARIRVKPTSEIVFQ
jgi:nicotinamidase-related amidase